MSSASGAIHLSRVWWGEKKSDKSTQKKNWENNRRNIQKGCKIVSIKMAGAKQERNSVVTRKQKKIVEFHIYNFTCLRICRLFLEKTAGVNLTNQKIDHLSTFWMSDDFLMINWWLPNDCLMTVWWLSNRDLKFTIHVLQIPLPLQALNYQN